MDTQNNNREIAKQPVFLTLEPRPVQLAQFTLMRLGSLTGRVVDEDRKPVSDLRVLVQAGAGSMRATGRAAVTDADGVFTVAGLTPQSYVVRIGSEPAETLNIVDDSPEEFQRVDQEMEASFWPLVPIRVQPGASADVGTITVRNIPHYRARVRFHGDCAPDEVWRVAVVKLPFARTDEFLSTSAPCRQQFLIRALPAGSYSLAVSTSIENSRWAQVPLVISSENVEVSIRLSPSADLTANVVVPSGVVPLELSKVRIELRPEDAPVVGTSYSFQSQSEGRFSLDNVPWQHHSFSISGVPKTHYIKAIRYAGQPVLGSSLSISPGGHLEIVLDDHPATIQGTIKGYVATSEPAGRFTFVTFAREPFTSKDPRFFFAVSPRGDGSFEAFGLAPGDYRVKVGSITILSDTSSTGVLVHVAAGDTRTVEVTPQ
ncbi:MAG: carboxypeptidase-like regulatory domain-containing protein [Bryobacteraceae bacterium]